MSILCSELFDGLHVAFKVEFTLLSVAFNILLYFALPCLSGTQQIFGQSANALFFRNPVDNHSLYMLFNNPLY